MSLVHFFVLSFFPQDVLGEIWDLIESVSEGFLTYSWDFQPLINQKWLKKPSTGIKILKSVGCLPQ